MSGYFGVRNFRHFDSTRDQIRLPCDLLDDRRFRALKDAHKAPLLCLLLLAARMENVMPRAAKLERLIGATEPVDLKALAEFTRAGSWRERSEIRPVSDAVRAAVLVRDRGRCRNCGSARRLEVDHIIPISRGGSSEEDNLQTLCRLCNRRKWRRLTPRL